MNTTDFAIVKQDIDRQRHRQRVVNAYHRVFNSNEGKAVIEDLKTFFATESAVFILSQTTHDAAVRDGQRQVLIRIREQLSKETDADGDVTKPKTTIRK